MCAAIDQLRAQLEYAKLYNETGLILELTLSLAQHERVCPACNPDAREVPVVTWGDGKTWTVRG